MITLGRCLAGLAAVVACAACSSPPAATPPATSTTTAASTTTPSRTTTTVAPTTTAADRGGQLPGDLTPNVVDDECLLTAQEYGALAGSTGIRAENTELAGGGGRRSCFYSPDGSDEPAARIDVYASSSLPPPELVARIVAGGGRPLAGVAQGAAVVTAQDGSVELVVASPALLAVLTVLPGGTAAPPSDQAWTEAATAMAGRLPR